MAADTKPDYNGFQQGDIAVRKGRLCVITKINWDVNPPDVTVKMQDNGAVVGTEFARLQRPSDEDMLKMPMERKQNKKDELISNNNRKRSYFNAFFEERKKRFSSKPTQSNHNSKHTANSGNKHACNNIPQITSHLNNKTFNDLLFDGNNNNNNNNNNKRNVIAEPPTKRTKLSHNFAQGWYCDACTVHNGEMDANKCYLCETPRTFQEKVKYPTIKPVIVPQNDNNTNNNNNNKKKKNENNIQPTDHKEEKKNDVVNQNSITFITWNVWFNEELQVIERMAAIGDIIDKHSADIVCFQEITPLILDILQNGNWYKQNKYESTILPSHGTFNGLRYFNVIMTKHEFARDCIQFKPFANTQMGRHLIITPIKLKNNKIIYAATSHFESPVGSYMGGKKDKFSAERKQQLQYSLQVLNDKNNCENNGVIFGGDMNWCRPTTKNENDGDINKYLDKNWIDCYYKLHPNKNGYTYDAKTNAMLSGYLCNRLDRILYKNNGVLRLKSCEMIGREAIPNLSYIKTFKRKNGDEQKILPVLPSDHYGLVAKFDIV